MAYPATDQSQFKPSAFQRQLILIPPKSSRVNAGFMQRGTSFSRKLSDNGPKIRL